MTPRIASVETVGLTALRIIWEDGRPSIVDLAKWIDDGGDILSSLKRSSVFKKAAPVLYGAAVSWDDEEGDLSIDAAHLLLLSEQQKRREAARIPKTKLGSWYQMLTRWESPSQYRATVDEILQLPELEFIFFKQAGLAFLRDAWIASRVAKAMDADAVRLAEESAPDFEIKVGESIFRFEATEADDPKRARGAEPYVGLRWDPVEDWRSRFEAIPEALNQVVSKKIKKVYPKDTSLVIYVNLACYGAYIEEGIPLLKEGTRAARDHFKAIYVMWEGWLFRFWTNGQDDTARWRVTEQSDF